MTRFAAGVSTHPLATQATGEVIGQILETMSEPPDVAVVIATREHAGALGDVVTAVRRLCNPRSLIGMTASGLVGGSHEIESRAGLVVWTARLGVDVDVARLDTVQTADGSLVVAGGGSLVSNSGTLVVLADPFSFPAVDVLNQLNDAAPGVTVIGGMASAGFGPGGNRLIADDEIFTDGAVGLHFPAEVPIRTIVSQGCRPIGEPMTVTRSQRNIVYELAGRTALDQVERVIARLTPHERQLAAAGLHIGRVVDEHRVEFRRGDFLVRGVLGADREHQAVVVGDSVDVGTTVQFHVRDAATAADDIAELTAGVTADAALLFTCTGRGSNLFDEPHHDATAFSDVVQGGPLAGAFCAGEIGPVGGRSFVHGFTASAALFG